MSIHFANLHLISIDIEHFRKDTFRLYTGTEASACTTNVETAEDGGAPRKSRHVVSASRAGDTGGRAVHRLEELR